MYQDTIIVSQAVEWRVKIMAFVVEDMKYFFVDEKKIFKTIEEAQIYISNRYKEILETKEDCDEITTRR